MAAIQFTFTRIGSTSEGQDSVALLLDDGFGHPEVVPLPAEILAGLRTMAVDPSVFGVHDAETAYGERLCELLVRAPAMARVQAYLLPHLGGGDRTLQLLFDVQDGVRELESVSWELLAGLQRPACFDALDSLDANRCIARVVRGSSNLKLPAIPAAKINVLLWTPLREDPIARDAALALFDRLNKLGDALRPVGPSADLRQLAQLALGDGHLTIVHIITHGTTDPEGNVRILTDGGSRDALGLEMQLRPLAPALQEGRILGVVLDVCRGGGGKRTESSPGRRLVTAGFPFAIAAEAPLFTDAAQCWSGELYRALANGASLYQAISSARTTTAGAGLDALDRFAWARQRLFLTNSLARRVGHLLELPLLDAGLPAAARPLEPRGAVTDGTRFCLRDVLMPLQKKSLASLEFAVSTLIEELDADGVRFGDGHLGRVERSIDELASGLHQAKKPLRRDEAWVLLSLVQLYSLGWMAVPAPATADEAARALRAAADEADAGEPALSELAQILCQLRAQVENLDELWEPIKRTLVALCGGLPESTRPFDVPPAGAQRPLLLAALLRVADALDAGTHRLDEFGSDLRGPGTVERWLHTYSRRGAITGGAIRFSFHVPDPTLLPVVKLAAAAPMWADWHGTLDTLVQAGLPVCVLPPRIEVHAGVLPLPSDADVLSAPQGLAELLAAQLQSSQSPRLHLVASKEPLEQYMYAPFACGGVDARDNVLHLPAPEERKKGGIVLFQIAAPDGAIVMPATPVELEAGEHLQVNCSQLSSPPLLPLRWTMTVPRWGRSAVSHEGIFWLLKPVQRRSCIEQLAHFSGRGDPLEQMLAQASILRSYGCWSAALMLLNEASNEFKDGDGLPLFTAMNGIYDRMLVVLAQLPGTQGIAARVRTNQEAVWRVYHQMFGVSSVDHQEGARQTASVLLRAAGLVRAEIVSLEVC